MTLPHVVTRYWQDTTGSASSLLGVTLMLIIVVILGSFVMVTVTGIIQDSQVESPLLVDFTVERSTVDTTGNVVTIQHTHGDRIAVDDLEVTATNLIITSDGEQRVVGGRVSVVELDRQVGSEFISGEQIVLSREVLTTSVIESADEVTFNDANVQLTWKSQTSSSSRQSSSILLDWTANG